MKTVQRGNKQLRVADDRLKDMLAVGYIEIDEKTGKPITTPEAADGIAALKKENTALKKENAALKKENKALKARVEELTVQSQE